ncbi:MAG TPA: methyltransferase domain-containing protein [Candidatus Binatia bacterium]|jgi:predicted methyltransferase
MKKLSVIYGILGGLLFLAAPAAAQDYKAILANPERPENERALDAIRKPEEMLKFYGVKPGDKVADLMASRGYYTAILSQAVGPKGIVHSATPTFRDETKERFKNPLYANVKLVEGGMGTVALPADGSLDFVLINLDYHEVDRADREAMNKRVFAALKPGGAYGVVDHSAQDGAGDTAAKTLHRIEKALVVKEVTAAGFKSGKEGEMLRNPDDPRTGNSLKEARGKTDRFVLKFEKPK